MANLLKWLSPNEFVIACARASRSARGPHKAEETVRACSVLKAPLTGASWTLDQAIAFLYFRTPLPCRALCTLARNYNCGAILAVYPDVHAVAVAQRAARKLGLPLAIYLHDTIAEGAQGSYLESYARKIQTSLFAARHLFFSMSEGMAELLLRKYNLPTVPLPHCYNETPTPLLLDDRKFGSRTALFAGSIYGINRPAVVRTAKAAIRAGYSIVCTSQPAADVMVADGISPASIVVNSLPTRAEYLASLREHDALFVALSWPHESPIHRDELATIFPTKMPEYLGAGRPILLHCPDDYFLAAFARRYECGLVVSERNEEALLRAWTNLRDDPHLAARLARNGQQAVSYFDGKRISVVFRQHIEALIR